MTKDEHNAQLQEMLDELKRIRERLDEVSDSAQKVTEAIRGVLSNQTSDQEGFDDAYRVFHDDL